MPDPAGCVRRRRTPLSLRALIKEILVFGEIAIARVTWTLTIRQTTSGVETKIVEPGLDVFRRDSDGKWRIIRYLAYDEG